MSSISAETLMGVVWDWLRACLVCTHRRAPLVEGKVHCPDCGQAVVRRWVRLRCRQCGIRRPARYDGLIGVSPMQRHCPACGDAHCREEVLEQPDYFKLLGAVLALESDADSRRRAAALAEWIHAWVEPSPASCAAAGRSFTSPLPWTRRLLQPRLLTGGAAPGRAAATAAVGH